MIVLLGSPRGILLAYPFSSNEEGSWAYPEELSATRTFLQLQLQLQSVFTKLLQVTVRTFHLVQAGKGQSTPLSHLLHNDLLKVRLGL